MSIARLEKDFASNILCSVFGSEFDEIHCPAMGLGGGGVQVKTIVVSVCRIHTEFYSESKSIIIPKKMFTELIPSENLLQLLEKCCDRPPSSSCFHVTETAFKKMLYYKYHTAFLAMCLPFYLKSQRHYITRPLTYNSWLTILRQISQSHEWNCKSVRAGGSHGLHITLPENHMIP